MEVSYPFELVLWENRLISITKKSEIISSAFERKAAARSLFDKKYKANQESILTYILLL